MSNFFLKMFKFNFVFILYLSVIIIVKSRTIKKKTIEERYIDLLPNDEKLRFLSKVARRIEKEVKPNGNESAGSDMDIPDGLLDAHGEYVHRILREVAENFNQEVHDNDSEIDLKLQNKINYTQNDQLNVRTSEENNNDNIIMIKPLIKTGEVIPELKVNPLPHKSKINDEEEKSVHKNINEYKHITPSKIHYIKLIKNGSYIQRRDDYDLYTGRPILRLGIDTEGSNNQLSYTIENINSNETFGAMNIKSTKPLPNSMDKNNELTTENPNILREISSIEIKNELNVEPIIKINDNKLYSNALTKDNLTNKLDTNKNSKNNNINILKDSIYSDTLTKQDKPFVNEDNLNIIGVINKAKRSGVNQNVPNTIDINPSIDKELATHKSIKTAILKNDSTEKSILKAQNLDNFNDLVDNANNANSNHNINEYSMKKPGKSFINLINIDLNLLLFIAN